MNKILGLLLSFLLVLTGCSSTNKNIVTESEQDKARTVITTDGEVDDMNSVIRSMLYSNDMDISGIVLTSSMYHYAGDAEKGIDPFRWTGTKWIYDFIDDYEAVYDNLVSHDKDYPTAEHFRNITKIGNIKNKGEMEEVTEGSKFLEELFLDDDERKLYVQTWGGTNTTARALKSIEEKYKGTDEWDKIKDKINNKLVLYIILDQDDSYANYIAKNWNEIEVINDRSNFWHFAYAWQLHSDELNDTLKADWCYDNLVKDKGPLMENYALIGDGKTIEGEDYAELRGTDDYMKANPNYSKYDFVSEGDSPSFLYLIDKGLRSMENPSFGGWGGRFGEGKLATYENTVLDYNPYTKEYEASYTLTRWFTDMQEDFASRVDWCLTTDDSKVNHEPSVSIEEGVDLSVSAGDTVTLTADGKDQDNDKLSYKWWRYHEADTYQDSVIETQEKVKDLDGLQIDVTRQLGKNEKIDTIEIKDSDKNKMSFVVPSDAKKGDTIHMVVEVQDDGAHQLKHYQRVIITVK